MPELPEVETQVRGLRRLTVGETVAEFFSFADKMFGDAAKFSQNIVGEKISGVTRKGKFIVFEFQSGKVMVNHLRMTGHFLYEKKSEYADEKHIRGKFEFENGEKLLYQDIRMFGKFWVGEREKVYEESGINRLGQDVHEISQQDWMEELGKRKGVIKSILLNQSFVAGIGNIYADESLFDAGISPLRRAETLTNAEKKALHKSAQKVIKMGIKHGGTTIGEYRDIENKSGTNQNYVQVYGRRGEKCLRCGTDLTRTVVSQRGTVYCKKCQK